MGTILLSIIFLSLGLSNCAEELKPRDEEYRPREERFSIFQIIKFENAPCKGGTRNGTCFTSAECESAGGKQDGDCADGFGVCCTTVLSAGGTTSLNQSYIYTASSAAVAAGGQTYKICPSSSDVCRIRFDFTAFTLAQPVQDPDPFSETDAVAVDPDLTHGASIGDCVEDQFSISSAQGGSPVICGENAGQHMILDTDGTGCVQANFGIGSGAVTRQWDIMVTQFKCGEEAGGPSGCLQWHMTATGNIRSFNFPSQAGGAAVADTTTHLSNQDYSVCIRKPAGSQRICYIPHTNDAGGAAAALNTQASFGVSLPQDANANSNQGVNCGTDYLTIPGADLIANVATDNQVSPALTRLCGRQFQAADNQAFADLSVCTNVVPFTVGVMFDDNEVTAGTANANEDETEVRPGGTIGFSLWYTTA